MIYAPSFSASVASWSFFDLRREPYFPHSNSLQVADFALARIGESILLPAADLIGGLFYLKKSFVYYCSSKIRPSESDREQARCFSYCSSRL